MDLAKCKIILSLRFNLKWPQDTNLTDTAHGSHMCEVKLMTLCFCSSVLTKHLFVPLGGRFCLDTNVN